MRNLVSLATPYGPPVNGKMFVVWQERRLEQEQLGREMDREMQERVTAAKLLQAHVADLVPGVLHSIDPYMEVENREQLERELGPWLANEVAEEVGQMIDSRALLEELVRQILVERGARYRHLAQQQSVQSIASFGGDDDDDDGSDGEGEGEGDDGEEEEEEGENKLSAEN